MNKSKTPKDVDSYIANADREAQSIPEMLRALIKASVPEAKETISWNVPIYQYHGILAGFSISKKHVSFGVDFLENEDRETLKGKGYKTGKKTVQIQFGQKVPEAMIKKIIKAQAKINELKKQ